jgi:hypothetical protein
VIAVRLLKRTIPIVSAAVLLTALAASPALALSPWWGLTSLARPTSIQPGSARDATERIAVSATGGNFVLRSYFSGFAEREFKWNATHEEVQAGLQEIYGAGNVQVSGGPGDELATKPYVVTFTGALADRSLSGETPVMRVEAGESFTGPLKLNCEGAKSSLCGAYARSSEGAEGRPDGRIVITAENLGDASTSEGSPVVIADRLPAGLKAIRIQSLAGIQENGSRGPVKCSLEAVIRCTFAEGVLRPYEVINVEIAVIALPGAKSGEANEASVSGGGAPTGKMSRAPVELGGGGESFGVEDYGFLPEEAGGALDTQAGSHPFQLTTTMVLNQTNEALPQPAGAQVKDLHFDLPPGLIGNPTPLPRCTEAQFATLIPGTNDNSCPRQSVIGVAVITVNTPGTGGAFTLPTPIDNLVPSAGEPARFAFKVVFVPVYLDTSVLTGGSYAVRVSVNNINQIAGVLASRVTFWGEPGDPRHDGQRGFSCLFEDGPCPPLGALNPPAFLSLPTSCTGPWQTSVEADSWLAPGVFTEPFAPNDPLPGLVGCNRLPFSPSLSIAPDVPDGSSPAGLSVGIHVPQEATLNPEGLAESTLKGTTVTLPEGLVLNPAGADGLEACSEAQIGFQGVDPASGADLFTAGMSEPFCPDASKIGTVKIRTPLLPNALEGAVYLAAQNANPFGSLVAMYIVAHDPVSGVLIKLPGVVKLDERTGRIVSTFENTPPLPFEELELHFFGGERAPLATPVRCGTYTTNASFTPWSGNEPATPSSSFKVTSGPHGSACPGAALPFSPSLTAGTTSIQAGGFTPFTMTMSREDGEQSLQGIQLKMPLGMSGTLSTVKLCGEEQANAGTCGPESLIGETTVSVGLGGDPFSVTGGKVYITGPYRGAPFGLSIVNPAKAGPYDLGKVVVRAKIEVNPETAALTITTDNEGPYKIPTILDGIPLEIKHVNVDINRPDFTFNATNCSPLAVTGDLVSTEGASSALSVPYQVTNCAVLAFKPKLEAFTSGRASRANGTSFTVRLGYPAGPYDANISRVKVELPKAMPSRLTTLQKACTAAVFESNPAGCPPASIVGHATAVTPVLPVPLSGPAYFVSHGGEAFPSLVIVLQGYGVTVHLVGSTFINKQGITSSTFKTVPDVPVGTFELTLPQGPYSALTSNTDLCKAGLVMPTEFVGQNGALIKTNTKIAATGCGKAKRASHKRKGKHSKAGHRGRGRKKG